MIIADRRKTTGFVVGNRVELHPATNRWMMGDRYGTIVHVGRKLVHVKMDKSEHLARLHPKNISRQF
jgi:hypothetical protein